MSPECSSDASVFSANRYVEYRPGKLNVIISVPHGGYLRPPSIPDRDAGSFINGQCVYAHGAGTKDPKKCPVRVKRDQYTKELGSLIARELTQLRRNKPHVVLNHLSRGKMDVNVEMDKGTFGVAEAVEAWTAYHAFIQSAKEGISGPGLLIDIHGQSHPEGWIELGYTLSREQLNEKRYHSTDTSVSALALRAECTASHQIQVRAIFESPLGSRNETLEERSKLFVGS